MFLSTLNEHSGRAKAGEVLSMRCGNICHRTSRDYEIADSRESDRQTDREA